MKTNTSGISAYLRKIMGTGSDAASAGASTMNSLRSSGASNMNSRSSALVSAMPDTLMPTITPAQAKVLSGAATTKSTSSTTSSTAAEDDATPEYVAPPSTGLDSTPSTDTKADTPKNGSNASTQTATDRKAEAAKTQAQRQRAADEHKGEATKRNQVATMANAAGDSSYGDVSAEGDGLIDRFLNWATQRDQERQQAIQQQQEENQAILEQARNLNGYKTAASVAQNGQLTQAIKDGTLDMKDTGVQYYVCENIDTYFSDASQMDAYAALLNAMQDNSGTALKELESSGYYSAEALAAAQNMVDLVDASGVDASLYFGDHSRDGLSVYRKVIGDWYISYDNYDDQKSLNDNEKKVLAQYDEAKRMSTYDLMNEANWNAGQNQAAYEYVQDWENTDNNKSLDNMIRNGVPDDYLLSRGYSQEQINKAKNMIQMYARVNAVTKHNNKVANTVLSDVGTAYGAVRSMANNLNGLIDDKYGTNLQTDQYNQSTQDYLRNMELLQQDADLGIVGNTVNSVGENLLLGYLGGPQALMTALSLQGAGSQANQNYKAGSDDASNLASTAASFAYNYFLNSVLNPVKNNVGANATDLQSLAHAILEGSVNNAVQAGATTIADELNNDAMDVYNNRAVEDWAGTYDPVALEQNTAQSALMGGLSGGILGGVSGGINIANGGTQNRATNDNTVSPERLRQEGLKNRVVQQFLTESQSGNISDQLVQRLTDTVNNAENRVAFSNAFSVELPGTVTEVRTALENMAAQNVTDELSVQTENAAPQTLENTVQAAQPTLEQPVAQQSTRQSAQTTIPSARTGSSSVTWADPSTPVNATWAVVSGSDLIASNNAAGDVNEAYPAELQPRDRTRAFSKVQMANMSNNLNPALLSENPTAQNGAPIIRGDGVVVSGNARTAAIQSAYQKGTAEKYQEYIRQHAADFGIDPNNLPADPVLVRIADSNTDFSSLAGAANASTTSSYSATENAVNYANNLAGTDLVSNLVPDAELDSAANIHAIQSFVQNVVPDSERGNMMTADGKLSASGLQAFKNTLFAAAYGDNTRLSALAEETDADTRNITTAMLKSSPYALQVKAAIADGNLDASLDFTGDVSAAGDLYSSIRNGNTGDIKSVQDYIDNPAMGDTLTDEAKYIALFYEQNARSGKSITEFLNALYSTALDSAVDKNQITFGGYDGTATRNEALLSAIDKYNAAHDNGKSAPKIPFTEQAGSGSVSDAKGIGAQEEQVTIDELSNALNQSAEPAQQTVEGLDNVPSQDEYEWFPESLDDYHEETAPYGNNTVGAAEAGKMYTSQAATNTLANAEGVRTNPEIQKIVKSLEDAGEFEVMSVSEQRSIRNAQNMLQTDYDAEVNRLSQKGVDLSDGAQDFDESMLLVADKTTAPENVKSILRNIVKAYHSAGQALQSAVKYNRTAAGMLAKAQQAMDERGRAWAEIKHNEANKEAIGNIEYAWEKFLLEKAEEEVTKEKIKKTIERIVKESKLSKTLKAKLDSKALDTLAKEIYASKGVDGEALGQMMENFFDSGLFAFSDESVMRVQELFTEAEQYNPNSRQFIELTDEALSIMAQQLGTARWMDKVRAFHYMSMLSSPRTSVKNTTGNIVTGAISRADNAMTTLVEAIYNAGHKGNEIHTSALGTARGDVGAAYADFDESVYAPATKNARYETTRGVSRGLARQQRVFKSDFLEGFRESSSQALDDQDVYGLGGMVTWLRTLKGNNKASAKLKALGTKAEAAIQEAGKNGIVGLAGLKNNYAREAAGYAKANGTTYQALIDTENAIRARLNNGKALSTEELMRAKDITSEEIKALDLLERARLYGVTKAMETTYHNVNELARAISDMTQITEQSDSLMAKAAGYYSEYKMPFLNTPINMMQYGLHHSLVQLLRGIYHAGKAKAGHGTKTNTEIINEISEGMTGTMISLLGAIAAQLGYINIVGSGDDRKDYYDENIKGIQNYSINLPGGATFVIAELLGPMSIAFFAGAAMWNAADKKGITVAELLGAITGMADPMIDTMMLSGIKNALQTYAYAGSNGNWMETIAADALSSAMQSMVPTVLKQVGRSFEPNRSSNYSSQEGYANRVLDNGLNKATNWIPFLQDELAVDQWGREYDNVGDNIFERLAYNLLSPGYYSENRGTAVDDALDELYEATGSSSVYPQTGNADPNINLDSGSRRMTEQEMHDYSVARGQTSYELVDALTTSAMWDGMSDENKQAALETLYKYANAAAKDDVFGNEYSMDNSNAKLDELYDAYGADGLVNYVTAAKSSTGLDGEHAASVIDELDMTEEEKGYAFAYTQPATSLARRVQSEYGDQYAYYVMKMDEAGYTGGHADANAWIANNRDLTNQEKVTLWKATNTNWDDKKEGKQTAQRVYASWGDSGLLHYMEMSANADTNHDGSVTQAETQTYINAQSWTQAQKRAFYDLIWPKAKKNPYA